MSEHTRDWICKCGSTHEAPGTCGRCGQYGSPASFRTPPMTTTPNQTTREDIGGGRYLADRFQWAAPGDQQEDTWIVRFCDQDIRDMIFTGPIAEAEAWSAWNRHAPGYNMYVFRLAALQSPTDREGDRLEWRSIESAPKDERFLAALEVHHNKTGQSWWEMHVIWIDSETGEINSDNDAGWSAGDYTHWRDLPEAPTHLSRSIVGEGE